MIRLTARWLSLSFSRKRFFLWFLLMLLLGWHVLELRELRNEGKIPLNDFIEYWSASKAFIQRQNPYSSSVLLEIQKAAGGTQREPLMMWNPPWTLPLLLPFSAMSYWTGRGLWYLFNLVMIFMIADWYWRLYKGRSSRRWMSWLAVLFFVPAGTALFLGQISPLLLAGLSGFLWALEKKRPGIAGAFLLLLAVKPHVLYLFWVFLLFWIFRERKWIVLFGGVTAVALSSLLALLINTSVFPDFWHSINSPSGPMIWQTPTWGIALHLMFPGLSKWIQFVPSVLGILAACLLWCTWRQDFDWKRYLPPILLLSIVTGSFTWPFDWVIFLPIVVLVLIWFQENPFRRWWLAGGLALIIVGTFVQPFIVHNYFYSIWLPPALSLVYLAGATANATVDRWIDRSGLATWKEKSL
jgi:hypothetical protein